MYRLTSLMLFLAALALGILGVGLADAAKVEIPPPIGGPGTGAGLFAEATGPATNLTGAGEGAEAGDLYVADAGNNRVQQFHADGSFVRAFGRGVDETGGGDVCEGTDTCTAGTASGLAGGMSSPEGVAVDPATGNLYVADRANDRIDVFSAEGAFEGAFGWGVVSGDISTTGLDFCTATSGCQAGFAGAAAGQFGGTIKYLAVAPEGPPDAGNLLVAETTNNRIQEFAPALGPGGEVTGASFVKAYGWDVVSSGPDNANQIENVIVAASGGSFELTFGGETTTELEYDAGAAEVQAALAALPAIGEGNVTVGGGPGDATGSDPYGITFLGALAGKANGPITAASGPGAPLEGTVTVPAPMNVGGAAQYEVCDVAENPTDVCKAGVAGAGAGQFKNALSGIAVDPTGAVYAQMAPGGACLGLTENVCRVQRLAPSGLYAAEFAEATLRRENRETEKVFQLAVDPATGDLLAVQESGKHAFVIREFDPAGDLLETSPPSSTIALVGSPRGIAVGIEGKLYLANGTQVLVFGPTPPPGVEMISVSAVTATQAEFAGEVTIPSPGGPGLDTGYHFEYSADGIHWTEVPATDVELGSTAGTYQVHRVVSGLAPNTDYSARLVATTSTAATSTPIAFKTLPTAPLVAPASSTVGQTTATLTALINPRRLLTAYHIEWGTTAAYGNRVPAFDRSVGAGAEAVRVEEPLSGLNPDTTYHFQIVATSAAGTTRGPDQAFTTLDPFGLPNGRAFELVSEADKGPVAEVGPILNEGIQYQVAPDGGSVVYPAAYGYPGSTTGGDVSYLAARSTNDWKSTQITPPTLTPSINHGGAAYPGLYKYLSKDLRCGVVASYKPLTPDTPALTIERGGANLYRRNPDGSFTLLSPLNPTNPDTGGSLSSLFKVVGASPSCSTVVFESVYHYQGLGSGELYEWRNGSLQAVGILPSGIPAGSAHAGGAGGPGNSIWNAVSPSGSQVIFTAVNLESGAQEEGKRAIFARRGGTETLNVSRSQTSTPDQGAGYQTASVDGSRIFFLANYGLTEQTSKGSTSASRCWEDAAQRAGATTTDISCDLYEYDTGAPAGERLTDLSIDTTDPNGAVVAGVLGASDNGGYVYFAAQGQLVAGRGNTYQQNVTEEADNVYLVAGGHTSFVGLLRKGDLEGGTTGALIGGTAEALGGWDSRVTPDGRRLLFASTADVTGYESGGVAEAYLYSAGTEEVVCISCRPDGKPSVGSPLATAPLGGEGAKSVPLDPPATLSADGRRVIFSMPDALAMGATEGQTSLAPHYEPNVYEWEEGQIYTLASGNPQETELFLVGASATGDEVFIHTRQRLAPQDRDGRPDLYVVKVGGGFPEPAPPVPPCDATVEGACNPAGGSPPAAAAPTTSTFSGPGNPPAKKHQEKKHRHHKKRHKHHKKKHKNKHQQKKTKKKHGEKAGGSRRANSDRRAGK